jgi:hypothetical protein
MRCHPVSSNFHFTVVTHHPCCLPPAVCCHPCRWFCLAAVVSPRPGVDTIVGFVAAAVGLVGEFSQEAPFLQQALASQDAPPGASSSSREHQLPAAPASAAAAAAEAAADPTEDHTAAAAALTGHAPSTTTSSSGVGDGSPPAAAAVAVEVVLLGVVSGYRRQGVASRLLQQVKRHARSQG